MIYLIDYENVKNLSGLSELNENDSVIIFYTKNANTLTFEELNILLNTKVKLEYKCVTTGQNALDFQLSSYIGYLIALNKTELCIISKDKGYESIINFWKSEKGITIKKQSSLTLKEQLDDITTKQTISTTKTKAKDTNETQIKKALSDANLQLTKKEISDILKIVSQYKKKQSINLNLQKTFKNNEKVSVIYKTLKPYLKNKT